MKKGGAANKGGNDSPALLDTERQRLSSTESVASRAQDTARKAHIVTCILGHQLATVGVSILTLQPRAQLLALDLGGDVTAVGQHINRGAALVAMSDFLLSPSVGALSDRIGRRPLMLLGPAVAIPLKLAAAMRPTARLLLVERVICDALRTLGGTTMAYACLADLYSGDTYTAKLVSLNSVTGLGIVLAPLVASTVARHPRRAYAISAALASVHLACGLFILPETTNWNPTCSQDAVPSVGVAEKVGDAASPKPSSSIAVSSPKASSRLSVRPVWRFLKLFTNGARLRVCACLFILHCLIEGKVLQDQVSILQLGAKWSAAARSRWTSGLGLAILTGSQIASPLIATIGEHKFTTLCHAVSIVAFMRLRSGGFWTGLALLSIGQQRRTTSSSWLVAEARKLRRVGHGEVVGWVASLRAAVDFVAALLYSAAHRTVGARGQPLDVMLFPAAVAASAEAMLAFLARYPSSPSGVPKLR